jgi:hypothetical protein
MNTVVVKTCSVCQSYRRQQRGPTWWDADCALRQTIFPNADDCAFYQPSSTPRPALMTGLPWNHE